MADWTLARWLAVALLACPRASGFPQRSGREAGRGPDSFRFPAVSNATGRSLPVFPDKQPLAPSVNADGVPLCRRSPTDTFCEKVDNYPDEVVMRSVGYSASQFRDLFGGERRPSLTRKARPGDPTESSLCPQRTRVFYPRAAESERGDWAFIVNGNDVEGDFVQAVMAEMCETKEQECAFLDGALPPGVTSRCAQKHAFKRLLALHPTERRTHTEAFRFPSCCVCLVSKPYLTAATLFRSRAPDKTPRTGAPA